MKPGDARRGALAEFWTDVGAAFGIWITHPLLPLFSVAIVALPQVASDAVVRAGMESGALTLFLTVVVVFSIGWPGTERFWYARAFQHERMPLADVWVLTWRYFGRYLRLGLLVVIVTTPFFVFAIFVLDGNPPLWSWALLGLVVDVPLTFVTPTLAFTTSSAVHAIGIGLRMLRREWPFSAAYALVPPLAFASLSWAWAPRSLASSSATAVGSVLLLLLFKGATVRFYLRRPPPEEEAAEEGTADASATR